jgi:surfactin synthase thioesterase subunit
MTGWTVRRHHRPHAATVLYCFPHAGGLPGEYVRWSDDLPTTEVWGVHLPGRTTRRTEPAHTQMNQLVDALVTHVTFGDSRPFAFFGHSLGALLAYEVTKELRTRGRHTPARLFLSSCPAPPLPPVARPVQGLSDEELIDAIEHGTGEDLSHLRADPDLRRHALDSFRADHALVEGYRPGPAEPLDCPVTVVAGSQEPGPVWRDGWAAHTRAGAELLVARGGHFHFRQRREELLAALRNFAPTTSGDLGWT